jgi:hypothetical protein
MKPVEGARTASEFSLTPASHLTATGSEIRVEYFEASPEPGAFIDTMRGYGYTLETALADLVDNSITANADKIQLFSESTPPFRIGILDNGHGMSREELQTAMKPACRGPLEERVQSDLGRFGLGLKTASFSQCQIFTVVTRKNGETSAARWNLHTVREKNQWLVEVPEDLTEVRWSDQLGETGTLVLWEELDRLVDDETSSHGSTEYDRRLDEACTHLELIFHRFMEKERGHGKVEISFNGRRLKPHDPFHSRHTATISAPVEPIRLGESTIRVQAFTLPHHSMVSKADWLHYAGEGGYVKNQGFYVYRERRLIIHGTWFGLAPQKELTKLSRVRVDIGNDLDAEWKIDVKKASAQLPRQVRNRLRTMVESMGITSKRVYKGRAVPLVDEHRHPLWLRHQERFMISYRLNQEHPVIRKLLVEVGQKPAEHLKQLLELIQSSLPLDTIFNDMSGQPEQVTSEVLSENALRLLAHETCAHLQETTDLSPEKIFLVIQGMTEFQRSSAMTDRILEDLKREGCNG